MVLAVQLVEQFLVSKLLVLVVRCYTRGVKDLTITKPVQYVFFCHSIAPKNHI